MRIFLSVFPKFIIAVVSLIISFMLKATTLEALIVIILIGIVGVISELCGNANAWRTK